jgi:hypothetical protein
VVLEESNNLVDNLDRRVSLALRVADLLWVAAALGDKVVTDPAMLALQDRLRRARATSGREDLDVRLHVQHGV